MYVTTKQMLLVNFASKPKTTSSRAQQITKLKFYKLFPLTGYSNVSSVFVVVVFVVDVDVDVVA